MPDRKRRRVPGPAHPPTGFWDRIPSDRITDAGPYTHLLWSDLEWAKATIRTMGDQFVADGETIDALREELRGR